MITNVGKIVCPNDEDSIVQYSALIALLTHLSLFAINGKNPSVVSKYHLSRATNRSLQKNYF